MNITSAEYILTAVKPEQYPTDNFPEIALVGRSNVGKSAFINAVTNRRALARISGKPGKTRTLNFYLINDLFYLVDLPGYGFARVSQKMKKEWAVMIEGYLEERENLGFVIQLVDIRHKPTADDKQMYQWLKFYNIPRAVVATKGDKLSRGRHISQTKIIREQLDMDKDDTLIVFSAVSRIGVETARDKLFQVIGQKG